MGWIGWCAGTAATGTGVAAAGYVGLVTGAISPDLGLGRRSRPLGPHAVDIVAQPYLGHAPRALADKIRVLDRGTDMVLAAHFTPVHRRLIARTVETVRFTRPERVDFRLVRGPIPHVEEEFTLTELGSGTRLEYRGEMAADLWRVGQRWAGLVARRWEQAVAASFASIKAEAERLASKPPRRQPPATSR